jgi:hypothetical protein
MQIQIALRVVLMQSIRNRIDLIISLHREIYCILFTSYLKPTFCTGQYLALTPQMELKPFIPIPQGL